MTGRPAGTEPDSCQSTDDAQREQLLLATAELVSTTQAAMQAFMQAFVPVAQSITASFAEIQRPLQSTGLLDADGKPTRPTDRPAWQSPYGPAQRRR